MGSICWVPVLLALGAGAACAQAPGGPNTTWGVSADALHRRLVERADDGTRLVKESGPMLRLAFDAQWRFPNGGALRAMAALAGGTLDYDGQTQAGTPLRSETDHRDLELGAAWRPLPPQAWGEGWLVLKLLEQRRLIASTPAARGLEETSRLLLAGVRWSHAFEAASWQWRPAAELRTSVRHRVEVDSGGFFDTMDLRGGRRHEAVLGLDASRAASPWSLGIAWTHARQSASPMQPLLRAGAPIGTVFQPRIDIDDLSVRLRRAF
jgi:hypothetical protein